MTPLIVLKDYSGLGYRMVMAVDTVIERRKLDCESLG